MDFNKAVVAKLKKDGENFEILVNCDKAIDFKKGKGTIQDAVVAEYIYKDSKKGDKASEHEIEKYFETTDFYAVAEIILKHGEIQLTAEYRGKLREEKRKKILELIHRNAIDSQTGFPHPVVRIEKAMEEAKVKIDEFKNAEEQIEDILEKIKEIIPIKFAVKEFWVRIPAQFGGQAYAIFKKFGKILKEDWGDGLAITIEIPGGMTEEFFSKLNSLTHGDVESKEIKK